MEDTACPPSTIFAAYNHMNCDKQIVVYDFLGHEYRDHMMEKNFFWVKKYL